MIAALEIKNLQKNYDAFSLKNVSFIVPEGYIVGFIGPNGAGKTTTIKSVLKMITPSSGEISLFGQENTDVNISVSDDIGIVMDSPFYVNEWTMIDVEKAVSIFYSKWNSEKYVQLLERFGIDKSKKVKELSRGMKVKLMLSVALSHGAKLLILDEPTSGLDPVARDELCEILLEFVEDESHSVLFSTHITSDLEKIADYIVFILKGEIVYNGTKEELLEKYVLVKGGLDEINAEHKKYIIGLREYPTGFEGMATLENLQELPTSLLVEPISLEEIIIYMNKEDKVHE